MNLQLLISPCPNDTFMFYALLHKKVECTHSLSFDFLDIEQLNQTANNAQADIMKLSFAQYPAVSAEYQILHSGAALGYKNGPLLISKREIQPEEIPALKIAIPGKLTTANMLLNIAYPNAKNTHQYLFSDIEEAVLSEEVDAGLIIHETRFTYASRSLKKVLDMGEYWENLTNLPLPLGAIIIRRNLPESVKQELNHSLHLSIKYAFEHPEEPLDFILQHSQEIDKEVCQKHINLYVNNYSLDLGETGKTAIQTLYQKAQILEKLQLPIFV